MNSPRRIVRLLGMDQLDEDEERPETGKAEVLPFVAPSATGPVVTRLPKRESPMPRGVYDRSKSKRKAVAALDGALAARKAVKAPKAQRVASGGFTVALDLRAGSVTINAAAGSLALAPDEVLALFAFLSGRQP